MTIFYLMGWEELCVCSSIEKAQKEVFPNSKPLSKLDGRWIMPPVIPVVWAVSDWALRCQHQQQVLKIQIRLCNYLKTKFVILHVIFVV